jgi:type VI secretion system protein ImpC
MAEEAKQAQPQGAAVAGTEESGVLDQIINETRIGKDDWERDQSRRQISTLVEEVMKGTLRVSKDLEATINARIADIDKVLSAQLNAIMHAPEFQKLEGAWRGLHYLVMQSETSTMLKIRVLNISKDELRKDLEKAVEFDQSALFKKVYEEEYGTFGGAPYGALIGDYEFGRHPQDLALLEKVSNVAASAHAPFISAAAPGLLGLEDFTDLPNPRDLAKKFETPDYAKWKSFRESEDSRYVGLTLPHVLMRLPYGPDTVPVEKRLISKKTWMARTTASISGGMPPMRWGPGSRMPLQSMAGPQPFVASRGADVWMDCRPIRSEPMKGEIALKCPTEIAITDRREKELSDLGFIPLVHCKGTDFAAFFGAQSCQKAKKYDTDAANANARLSTQLQYLLAMSRFAHYLKSIMRDKIGSFMTRKDCEDFLNRWISKYVVSTEDAGQEIKAKFPLKEARVEVAEVAGKPGVYRAIAFLKPHFQLDELTVSLRLVAELPPPAKR